MDISVIPFLSGDNYFIANYSGKMKDLRLI